MPMNFQFLTDRYKWELDRKDKISSAVNFPVTILALVAGLLGTLFSKLQLVPPRIMLLSVLLFLIAVGLGFKSAFEFMRAYHGTSYSYLPLLRDLETMRLQLEAQEDPDDEPDREFTLKLGERIIEATDGNTASNDRRQAFLERGNIALIWMIVFTGSCGLIAFLVVMIEGR